MSRAPLFTRGVLAGAALGGLMWFVGGLIPPDVPPGSNPRPTVQLAPWLSKPCSIPAIAVKVCDSHGAVVNP